MPQPTEPIEIVHRIEPHRLFDRVRGKLLFLLAWPTLVVAMRRRSRRTELWIGDSHAMGINRTVTNGMFMRAPRGIVLRGGARLMFSLANKGFPPRVMRVARFVNRFGRPGALVPIFSAGDIDIRVHLPKRPDAPLDFVEPYVERCVEVAHLLKADRIGFFLPPPPVDVPEEHVWFPITGTIEERVAVHDRVREALVRVVAEVPGGVIVDVNDVLVGANGGMPVQYTTDGAHTNAPTIARIQARLDDYRLTDPLAHTPAGAQEALRQ